MSAHTQLVVGWVFQMKVVKRDAQALMVKAEILLTIRLSMLVYLQCGCQFRPDWSNHQCVRQAAHAVAVLLAVSLLNEVRRSDIEAMLAIIRLLEFSEKTRNSAIDHDKGKSQTLFYLVLAGGLLLFPEMAKGLLLGSMLHKQHQELESVQTHNEELSTLQEGSLAAGLSIDGKGNIQRTMRCNHAYRLHDLRIG